jgi:hypothetical protein
MVWWQSYYLPQVTWSLMVMSYCASIVKASS